MKLPQQAIGPERHQRAVMERARVLCHESATYRLQQLAHHYTSLGSTAALLGNVLRNPGELTNEGEALALTLAQKIIDSHREHFGCDPAWLAKEEA